MMSAAQDKRCRTEPEFRCANPPTGKAPVDVPEMFLKGLLAVVLMLTSAVAVRLLLVAF